MASTHPPKAFTWRVTEIPPDTSKRELERYFSEQDRLRITVGSICPDAEGADQMTATVLFRPHADRPHVGPKFDSYAPKEMEVDRDFWGFTPLYCPPEDTPITADIIAITGLAGNAFGSWAHSEQRMWLRDYLPNLVNNARILTYGYDTRITINKGSVTMISDLSNSFIDSLINMRRGTNCEQRPIIFIGHSLGGLLIKKIMTIARNHRNPDISRLPVRAIVFLAAPHQGMNVDALRTLVGHEPLQLVEELASGSTTLNDLNEEFRSIAQNIEILTCFEALKTKTVAFDQHKQQWTRSGPEVMMVETYSAKQDLPKETVVNVEANHSGIAKLEKGVLLKSIRGIILRALTPSPKLTQAEPRNKTFDATVGSGFSRTMKSSGNRSQIQKDLNDKVSPSPNADETNHRSRHSSSLNLGDHSLGHPLNPAYDVSHVYSNPSAQADYRSYFQGYQAPLTHDYQRPFWNVATEYHVPEHLHVPRFAPPGHPETGSYPEKQYQARFSSYPSPVFQYSFVPPFPGVPPAMGASSAETATPLPRHFYQPVNQNVPHDFTHQNILGNYLEVPTHTQVPGHSDSWRQPGLQRIHLASMTQGMEQMSLKPDGRYSPDVAAHLPTNVPFYNTPLSPNSLSEVRERELEVGEAPRFLGPGSGNTSDK